jgi:hypothetical protein
MEELETEYKIVQLTNKAIQFRKSNDLINFNLTIQEIDDLYFYRKFELLQYLFPESTDDTMDWTDKFILNDIKLGNDTLECFKLLETLIMISVNSHDDSFYQNIVTTILQKIDIETDEIYYIREFLIKNDILKCFNCVPEFFELKENEIHPDLVPTNYWEYTYEFIENKDGMVELDLHPFYGNEFTDDEIEMGKEDDNYRIEENLKLIPTEDTLKADFLNCKNFFFRFKI